AIIDGERWTAAAGEAGLPVWPTSAVSSSEFGDPAIEGRRLEILVNHLTSTNVSAQAPLSRVLASSVGAIPIALLALFYARAAVRGRVACSSGG
ncbi:MAG: hypothetical protein MUE97_03345, partial [Phycisphaerales bacterium]|nr:hypothetical protein [Phycisphaerales bacterium]